MGRINRTTGRREGGIIGLTSGQAKAVSKARVELESGDSNYFTRKLRDKRLDGLVKRAFSSGKPVAKADIDRITGKYSDRLLKLRGETIARTEGLNAYRAANYEAYRQLIESGAVREDQISREWDSTLDKRTRDQHVAMEGVKVQGLSQPFLMPDGSLMKHPGDASLGAPGEQIIACRCAVKYRVKYL